jgi:hypothetical protein
MLGLALGSVDEALLERQLAYHRAAGVDVFVVPFGTKLACALEILEAPAGVDVAAYARDHAGCDWILESDANTFWWPRGWSLGEVLAALPDRYGEIIGAERVFPLPESGDMSIVPAVRRAGISTSTLTARRCGGRVGTTLPTWRPLEVFRLAPVVADGAATVADTRLTDALAAVESGGEGGELRFPRPSIADDATYALELAASESDELDVVRLVASIDALEQRIDELERTRFLWLRRQLRRLS